MIKAKFLILAHGRVATASLLEGFQFVPNLFVPSYWHTDKLLLTNELNYLLNYNGRYISQIRFPDELPNMHLGLVSHHFPIERDSFEKIAKNTELFLIPKGSIFIYERDFKENILSSYKAYLTTWFCFYHSNKKLIPSAAFKTTQPLRINDFIYKYSTIADTDFQVSTYASLGLNVIKHKFENLNDLDSEIKKILKYSDIEIPCDFSIPNIKYSSKDSWPIQTAFAFHNKFIINRSPLSVGFFSPYRRHPNQGTLTHKIHTDIYVSMDQWFLLPEKYKEAIISCNDPWGVVNYTKENFKIYESKILKSVEEVYATEVLK